LNQIAKVSEIVDDEFERNYFLDLHKEMERIKEEQLKAQKEKENIDNYSNNSEIKKDAKKQESHKGEEEEEEEEEDPYAKKDDDYEYERE
jgi:hypothetical protein